MPHVRKGIFPIYQILSQRDDKITSSSAAGLLTPRAIKRSNLWLSIFWNSYNLNIWLPAVGKSFWSMQGCKIFLIRGQNDWEKNKSKSSWEENQTAGKKVICESGEEMEEKKTVNPKPAWWKKKMTAWGGADPPLQLRKYDIYNSIKL